MIEVKLSHSGLLQISSLFDRLAGSIRSVAYRRILDDYIEKTNAYQPYTSNKPFQQRQNLQYS